MKTLVVLTGPQGSGNHLFSRVFASSPGVFGWNDLLKQTWQGHHEEPFALYWQGLKSLNDFNWSQSDIFVTSISCPYFFNGQPQIPDYRKFLNSAERHVDKIAVAIIGRDQNILSLQQTRLRGEHTSHLALKELAYLQDRYTCSYLSQELLYLYKRSYIMSMFAQLDSRLTIGEEDLARLLVRDANAKYVAQALGDLDSYIINSSKNSFRDK